MKKLFSFLCFLMLGMGIMMQAQTPSVDDIAKNNVPERKNAPQDETLTTNMLYGKVYKLSSGNYCNIGLFSSDGLECYFKNQVTMTAANIIAGTQTIPSNNNSGNYVWSNAGYKYNYAYGTITFTYAGRYSGGYPVYRVQFSVDAANGFWEHYLFNQEIPIQSYLQDGSTPNPLINDPSYVNVAIESGQSQMGSVEGSTIVEKGSQVTIRAIANEQDNYIFKYWKEDQNIENPRTFTTTQTNHSYTAVFEEVSSSSVELSLSVENLNGQTVNWGVIKENNVEQTLLTKPIGAHITINAVTSNNDYYFVKWQEDHVDFQGNNENPLTITVSKEATYTAIFETRDVVNITASDDMELTYGETYWSVAGAGTDGNNNYTMNIRFDVNTLTGTFNSGVNTANTWLQEGSADKVYAQDISVASITDNSGLLHISATIIGSDQKKYIITGYCLKPVTATLADFHFGGTDVITGEAVTNAYSYYWPSNDYKFVIVKAHHNSIGDAQYGQVGFYTDNLSTTYNGIIGPAAGEYNMYQPGVTAVGQYDEWSFSGPKESAVGYQYDIMYGGIGLCGQGTFVAGWNGSNKAAPVLSDMTNNCKVYVSEGKNGNMFIQVVRNSDNAVLLSIGDPKTPRKVTIANPGSGKTITVKDAQNNTYATGTTHRIPEGTVLTISVSTTDHTHVSGWTGTGNAGVSEVGTSGTIFTLTVGAQNYDLTASFDDNQYYLNATVGTHGTGVTRSDNKTNSDALAYDATVTLTPVASEGYEFDKWAGADKDQVVNNVFSIPSNALHNTTYNVQATFQASSYGITYLDKGGVVFSGAHESGYPTTHTYNAATTLKSASKTGYDFGGWFTDENCTGSAITELGATAYTGSITLYANWTEQTYNIYYKDKGNAAYSGNNEGSLPTSHTYDVPTDLVDGTKDGFTFLGWFTDENCTVSAGLSIAANSITADITLYADWEERVTHEIELNDNITDISEYASLLTTYAGQEVNVTLAGRTLAANRWHTLCLPFDYDTYGSALDGRVYELNDCTTDATNGMTITFYPAEYNTQREADIIAGRPYLVWIDQAVTTPLRFEGVTLTTFTPQTVSKTDVDFKANIPQQTLTDKADIFINNNRLYYPKTSGGSILRAFRAYFHIKNANGMSYAQPRVRIVAEGASGETMTVLETDIDAQAETRKYVEDGILIIERGGVRYDAQGKRME